MQAIIALDDGNGAGCDDGSLPWPSQWHEECFRFALTEPVLVVTRGCYEQLPDTLLQHDVWVLSAHGTAEPRRPWHKIFPTAPALVLYVYNQTKAGKDRDYYVLGGVGAFEALSDEIMRWHVTRVPGVHPKATRHFALPDGLVETGRDVWERMPCNDTLYAELLRSVRGGGQPAQDGSERALLCRVGVHVRYWLDMGFPLLTTRWLAIEPAVAAALQRGAALASLVETLRNNNNNQRYAVHRHPALAGVLIENADGALDIVQASADCDVFNDHPRQLAEAAVLLSLLAHCSGRHARSVTFTYGCGQLYMQDLDRARAQLEVPCDAHNKPVLMLNPAQQSIEEMLAEDVHLLGYRADIKNNLSS